MQNIENLMNKIVIFWKNTTHESNNSSTNTTSIDLELSGIRNAMSLLASESNNKNPTQPEIPQSRLITDTSDTYTSITTQNTGI